jgi:hypothetical protein
MMNQVNEVEFTEQEMEAMWAESTKESIASDIPLIATIQDDEHGEGVEELIETYTSHWNTFSRLRKAEESGRTLSTVEKEVYVSIVDNILIPILDKMNQWGYKSWVKENEFTYEI